MMSATAKGKIAERVKQRVEQNRCLVGDCEQQPLKRGLCSAHYYHFQVALREQSNHAARVECEEAAIAAGLVLAAGEVRKIRRPNPFTAR